MSAPIPSVAWVNGEFKNIDDATVSVLDRGFLFADGVYDVAAVIAGRAIDLPAHLNRMARSLHEMKLTSPVPLNQLPGLMTELIQRESLQEGMIYLQVTRGADRTRGFSFPDSQTTPATLVMFAQQKKLVDNPDALNGVTAISIPDIRWRRRDIKSISLLPQVLGKQLATEAGAFEAIMIEDGYVTEGTSSAVGMIRANELVTRPISNDILDSITRRAIDHLCQQTDLKVVERKFALEELVDADEVFVASATALITPVISIDGHAIGNGVPGPWAQQLRKSYLSVAITEDTDMASFEWND